MSSRSWYFWRLRYELSLRDLPEMFVIRRIDFSYEAVRDWETHPKVPGRWCYLISP